MLSAWRSTGWVAPLALLLCLGLAGCVAVTPPATPALEEPPEAPDCVMVLSDMTTIPCADVYPPLTNGERDIACTPIVPFEANLAGQFMAEQGLTVGWTFGVNFDVTGHGAPLACLRLYHLKTEVAANGAITHTAAAIDRGGMPVATCEVIDGATIDAERGLASFCGQGRVQCRMRLNEWFVDEQILALAAASAYEQGIPMAPQEVEALAGQGENAPYPKISLIARAAWAPAQTLASPILYATLGYSPTEVIDPESMLCRPTHWEQPLVAFVLADASALQHVLAINVDSPNAALFSTTEACNVVWPLGTGWNTTYNHLADEFGTPQHMFENKQEKNGRLETVATCTHPAAVGQVEFWQGEGALMIGELDGISMEGVIDGVLIDPLDSRPPS